MRKFLQNIFTGPVIKLANKLSSRPDKGRVDKALSELHAEISAGKDKAGLALQFDAAKDKFR
ncbi:hypothetical protein [Mucilaginibacter flavidus]|uniref:hypothetical protein n=1 Tax=Mucilaginibacter flavidus TaxID=2949309 RepID=UPI0020922853|nr:hypothetical protein [Mucilaginibacter flavidus]MCO5950968.1 hypothetical protein [Mucilaginibacter flavidus]